tara:strand:- start:582 stop:887 length:306 start_codon:yes stop_codon:yes gene_type:complete
MTENNKHLLTSIGLLQYTYKDILDLIEHKQPADPEKVRRMYDDISITNCESEELLRSALWCIRYLTKLNEEDEFLNVHIEEKADAICKDIEDHLKECEKIS